MNVKKIMIIGTGGTIAGTGNGASALTEYRAGSIGVEELMQAVPTLERYGPFESIQFSNIDSSEMSPYRWVRLALLINDIAKRDYPWHRYNGRDGILFTLDRGCRYPYCYDRLYATCYSA